MLLKDDNKKKLIEEFIQFSINIGLLYFSLKYLSNYYKEIVVLSKNLFDVSFSITNKLYMSVG